MLTAKEAKMNRLLCHVWFFATPGTAAHQATLSFQEFTGYSGEDGHVSKSWLCLGVRLSKAALTGHSTRGGGALASRTMRESIPVVLSHPVGGNSSWQPQKTNVACKTHYWLITILIPASNSHCHLAHDIKPTFYLQTRQNFYKRHGGNLLSPPNNNNKKTWEREKERNGNHLNIYQ